MAEDKCKCEGCSDKCQWAFNIKTCCGCESILSDRNKCPYILFPKIRESLKD
jgi:hypothetical protein